MSDSARRPVHGVVAPGFDDVRTEFERNFSERGEIGAAVAAYVRGEKVVDLWGGRRITVALCPEATIGPIATAVYIAAPVRRRAIVRYCASQHSTRARCSSHSPSSR